MLCQIRPSIPEVRFTNAGTKAMFQAHGIETGAGPSGLENPEHLETWAR